MKKIFIQIAVMISILGFTSCNDMLDRPPLDKIGNDSYWHTASDLEKYTTQFYTLFPTYGSPGYTGIFLADAAYGSDDAILEAVNTTLNGARAVVNSGGNWTWGNIRSVNIFFDNYAKCKDNRTLWEHYLGEAHFFRAYLYFDKVKAYGDVPYYSTELLMDSPELYDPRMKRTDVIDSILVDLDNAIEFLKPISDVEGGTNRLSKEVALLFKSRVALYEGTWQKYHAGTPFGTTGADPKKYFQAAVNAAEELMSGKYRVGVHGKSAEDFGLMFGANDLANNQEVLLWKKYDKSLNLSHDSQVYHTTRTNARSATLSFVRSFLGKDGNPIEYNTLLTTLKGTEFLNHLKENADPRLRKTIWMPGDVIWDSRNGYKEFSFPYLGQSGEFINLTGFQLRKGVDVTSPGAGGFFGGDCETASIVFRYAEVLLNYAEAKYELDGAVDYNKSINLLRRRVGMPDFKVLSDTERSAYADYGYEISDELHEIRRERRVELGAEGYRNVDYKRWRAHKLFQGKRPMGYPVLTSEYAEGTKFPAQTDGVLDPFKARIPNGYQFDEGRDYLQCIPTNEITLNENLVQNPGWE